MSLQHILCGNMFKVKPINILNNVEEYKKYCPKCKNDYKRNEFNEKIVNYYGNDYQVYGEYDTSSKKVKIQHKRCGSIIEKRKNNLYLTKNLCPKCRKSDKDKKQIEKINESMKLLYNNEIVFKGEYKGMREKSKFYCNKCNNEFDRSPQIMLRSNNRCPHCNT